MAETKFQQKQQLLPSNYCKNILKQLALIQNDSCNTVKNDHKKQKLSKAKVTKTNSKIGKKAQKVVKCLIIRDGGKEERCE